LLFIAIRGVVVYLWWPTLVCLHLNYCILYNGQRRLFISETLKSVQLLTDILISTFLLNAGKFWLKIKASNFQQEIFNINFLISKHISCICNDAAVASSENYHNPLLQFIMEIFNFKKFFSLFFLFNNLKIRQQEEGKNAERKLKMMMKSKIISCADGACRYFHENQERRQKEFSIQTFLLSHILFYFCSVCILFLYDAAFRMVLFYL